MAAPKQISFRPDEEIRHIYDLFMDDDWLETVAIAAGENGVNVDYGDFALSPKVFISHLIRKEYERVEKYMRKPGSLNDLQVFEAVKYKDWPDLVPAKVEIPSGELTRKCCENGWESWYTRLDLNNGPVPDEGHQLSLGEVMMLYRRGIINGERIAEFRGATSMHVYQDPENGELIKAYHTNLGVIEHAVDQRYYKYEAEFTGPKDGEGYISWRMAKVQPALGDGIDLSNGKEIQNLITADSFRVELIELPNGAIYSRKTKVNANGDGVDIPAVQQIRDAQNDKEAPEIPDQEVTAEQIAEWDKQSEDYEQARAIAHFEATVDTIEHRIRKHRAKYYLPHPDYKKLANLAAAAFRRGDENPIEKTYAYEMPPRVINNDGELNRKEYQRWVVTDRNLHLQEFYKRTETHIPQGAVGKPLVEYLRALHLPLLEHDPRETGEEIDPEYYEEYTEALSRPMDRKSLLSMCQPGSKVSTERCFLAILAFMAHRIDHVKSAWALIDAITPTLKQLRTKKQITRKQAYDQLRRLRQTEHLPGLRPATYCSLIYFLRPTQDGYMLSSHTAKSINLIAGDDIIQLNQSGYPTDENTAENYEAYCQIIDHIGAHGHHKQMSGAEVEERLQSYSEPLVGEWREYLGKFENVRLR